MLPIYIGDDRTDEDAFQVLRDKGDGYGILVSAVPKETCACYSLRDPSEVRCLSHHIHTYINTHICISVRIGCSHTSYERKPLWSPPGGAGTSTIGLIQV